MSGSDADADAAAGKQDDSRTLELLLADYQQCRDDERSWVTLIVSLIAIVMSLIGLITGAVTESCALTFSTSCIHVPGALVASAPLLPCGIMTLGSMYGMIAVLRSFYMRRLEQEILAKAPKAGNSNLEIVPFNFIGLITYIQSPRRGHRAYLWLSSIVELIGLIGVDGLVLYIGLHMADHPGCHGAGLRSYNRNPALRGIHNRTARPRVLRENGWEFSRKSHVEELWCHRPAANR